MLQKLNARIEKNPKNNRKEGDSKKGMKKQKRRKNKRFCERKTEYPLKLRWIKNHATKYVFKKK